MAARRGPTLLAGERRTEQLPPVPIAPFALDPRLEADTVAIGALPLCRVLLHRDANYPWVILVPARAGITEIHQLGAADRRALIEESSAVAEAMQRLLQAPKMNVAALGNVVPQLHVHHVARFPGDPAWPRPIWGAVPPVPYAADAEAARLLELRAAFAAIAGFRAADPA